MRSKCVFQALFMEFGYIAAGKKIIAINNMNVLNYRILLKKEPEGGYTVLVPSLPGCVTYGETIGEVIDMAKEAIELYIESLKEHGEVIPTEEGFSSFEGMVR